MHLEVTGPVEAAEIHVHADGHVEIPRPPKVTEFTPSFLEYLGPQIAHVDDAGHLDLAGQAVYRPVRFRADLAGRVTLVCERVR